MKIIPVVSEGFEQIREYREYLREEIQRGVWTCRSNATEVGKKLERSLKGRGMFGCKVLSGVVVRLSLLEV